MLNNGSGATFPGGSKTRVSKAGDRVRRGQADAEDLHVIEQWRDAHRAVLNTFQAILRIRAAGKIIVVAQRHKRKRTIFDKLRRFPGMELARMDDVAGCRLIFQNTEELSKFRNALHSARFNHSLRNKKERYDYIANPKDTGYRGIHDIYEYNVNSTQGKPLKGLLIELQYRTQVQHAWATCVEVIGFITKSQPKFKAGDVRYEQAMALASEIIARAHENLNSCFPDLGDKELIKQFLDIEKELKLLSILRGLNASGAKESKNRNLILIFSQEGPLEIRGFRDAPEALRALFAIERDEPEKDVVLVRADTTDDVRVAFKNYFSDASEFIRLIDEGCAKLASGRSAGIPKIARSRSSGPKR